MKSTYPLSRFVVFATTYCIFALASGAPADSAGLSEKSSWLLGKFTQNAPCKGDGTDPAELKVPAILARAPAATIAGAVSYDPTVAVHTRIPLCSTSGAKTDPQGGFAYGPWPSLPGFWVVAFPVGSNGPERQHIAVLKAAGTPVDIARHAGNGAAETLAALVRPRLTPTTTPTPTGIAKLPLIELPAEPSGPLLAIVLSGDGGWRDIDKNVSEKLQSAGVSVVGWDCLRYFWSRKSPEQVARHNRHLFVRLGRI